MTDREMEFQRVKDTVRENIDKAQHGIYFTRNVVEAPMSTVFIGKNFTVEICRQHGYLEVFGCSRKEENLLTEYYNIFLKEKKR